jgi:Recombination endonuclease VII
VIANVSNVRKNLARHGITWEQREWLVRSHQHNTCPICLKAISSDEAHIDHSHDCWNKSNHSGKDFGCINCIRAGIHSRCNSHAVWALEEFPHLQTEDFKKYLTRRPFIGR